MVVMQQATGKGKGSIRSRQGHQGQRPGSSAPSPAKPPRRRLPTNNAAVKAPPTSNEVDPEKGDRDQLPVKRR